ncbi:ribonuclease R [Mycoplasma wenyonii]|uniref:Ribonuclease R n=1 Tax=Mycoplasma wenyonii TaxID=65123 RepID=A0A328PPK4_9MOLU|nr:ribonuclease R [Mycoplasma wenyonii]RAO95066.1 ribonuclease R [Mycoplasma wenyonii]
MAESVNKPKTNLSEKQIEDILIKLLLVDPKPIPFNVLKSKFFRYIRFHHSQAFLSDETFSCTLNSLKQRYLIGENQYGKWYIDYLDYKPSGRFGKGFIDINEQGNGFITVKQGAEKFKKSSHFVHRKNLNGAKSGNYVKFEELEPQFKKKRVSRFSLIDATVVEILEEPNDSNVAN